MKSEQFFSLATFFFYVLVCFRRLLERDDNSWCLRAVPVKPPPSTILAKCPFSNKQVHLLHFFPQFFFHCVKASKPPFFTILAKCSSLSPPGPAALTLFTSESFVQGHIQKLILYYLISTQPLPTML